MPDASGDAAKACSVAFSTAGGEVQANIDRWAGQVLDASGAPSKPKITKRQAGGMPVTTAEMTGTYAGMGDTAPHANWTMRAAIVETPGGLLFIKMTGPMRGMASAEQAWNQMLHSMVKAAGPAPAANPDPAQPKPAPAPAGGAPAADPPSK